MKRLSLPVLSLEKLPLPKKRYEELLERFRDELEGIKDKRRIEIQKEGQEEDKKEVFLKMIYELCDKMELRLKKNYFIKAFDMCYERYDLIYDGKVFIAAFFILILSHIRGDLMIHREEKERILFILGIPKTKQRELKRWIEVIKRDNEEYKWIESIFEGELNPSIEVEPLIEIEPQYRAISGIGMMVKLQNFLKEVNIYKRFIPKLISMDTNIIQNI